MSNAPSVLVFLCRTTRSAQPPKEVLGTLALKGVLVVDRYNADNRSPCALQSCYAHLLRGVEDWAREFPGEAEVAGFTSTLIPLLTEAMPLRGRPVADLEYDEQAGTLQPQIGHLVEPPRITWVSARCRNCSTITPIVRTTGRKIGRSPRTTNGPSANCARQ